MSSTAEIEAMLFKPVQGGYVFQAPTPWLFRRRSYLVSEAQKAELLAIVVPHRPLLWIALVTMGVLLWAIAVALLVWAVSPHDDPTVIDGIVMVALIVAPLIVALIMMRRRNLRRMQPILASAQPTKQSISNREMRQAMADAMPLRRMIIFFAIWAGNALIWISILVARNDRHPLFSDFQSFMNAFTGVVTAGLAVYYLVLIIRKLGRNGRTT